MPGPTALPTVPAFEAELPICSKFRHQQNQTVVVVESEKDGSINIDANKRLRKKKNKENMYKSARSVLREMIRLNKTTYTWEAAEKPTLFAILGPFGHWVSLYM